MSQTCGSGTIAGASDDRVRVRPARRRRWPEPSDFGRNSARMGAWNRPREDADP
jgi:hypothetical protein